MKPKKISNKFLLNKMTVANLSHEALRNVKGAGTMPCIDSVTCDPCLTGFTCSICDTDLSCHVEKCFFYETDAPVCTGEPCM